MNYTRAFVGELIGTFIMCFAGIGAVATATLYGALTGPGQVGLVWGLAIAISIYLTRNLSDAHFNPAVTIAMCLGKRLPWRYLPVYFLGQIVGAFAAAAALWGMYAASVAKNLANAGLSMSSNSIGSAASIWCEIFPNTTNAQVSYLTGMFAEGMGVFVLVLVIFSVTAAHNSGRPSSNLAPLFIGLTITIMITAIGPLTDAGLNPFRDLMPRVWACVVGWGSIAFGSNAFETFMVYCAGPVIGAVVAALLYTYVIDPLHAKSADKEMADASMASDAKATANSKAMM